MQMSELIPIPDDYGTEILRTEVGSTLHGTGLGVALEDHDEMAIYVENPESTIGLRNVPEFKDPDGFNANHYVVRTAAAGERSQPGDTDLVTYSLRKWAKLALKGNPSVLLVLFAPEGKIVVQSQWGDELRSRAEWFASLQAGEAFLGYMQKQRERMVGQRGRAGRVRLIDENCQMCQGGEVPYVVGGNYDGPPRIIPCPHCNGTGKAVDWKYAMHMLRLGYQGVEYLTDGKITLPVPGAIGDHLRNVRTGGIAFGMVIEEAESLEEMLKDLLAGKSPLPPEPAFDKVQEWVVDAHMRVWVEGGLR